MTEQWKLCTSPILWPPPAVLTDYYYGNHLAYASKMAMRETGKLSALPCTSCPVLDFLTRWKCINVIGLCHSSTGIEHYHIYMIVFVSNVGTPFWMERFFFQRPLSANYTKSTEKAGSHYPGYVYFTLNKSCPKFWYADLTGTFGVKAVILLDFITMLPSLFWSCKELLP